MKTFCNSQIYYSILISTVYYTLQYLKLQIIKQEFIDSYYKNSFVKIFFRQFNLKTHILRRLSCQGRLKVPIKLLLKICVTNPTKILKQY